MFLVLIQSVAWVRPYAYRVSTISLLPNVRAYKTKILVMFSMSAARPRFNCCACRGSMNIRQYRGFNI